VEIYTIGFTQKSAAEFFGILKQHGIRRLVDVRLNNVSQLAGFSKRDDLAYFLEELVDAEYRYEPLLAPTQEMLDDLKKRRGSWVDYENRFLALMRERQIEHELDPATFEERTVLLCSEPTPERCHRRLVVEYLDAHWGDVRGVHL
jgi:uncharacterized protein (DUF488 family)